MSETPKRTLRISDVDFTTVKALAFLQGIKPSDLMNRALAEYVAKYGREWQGAKREGRPRKATP